MMIFPIPLTGTIFDLVILGFAIYLFVQWRKGRTATVVWKKRGRR